MPFLHTQKKDGWCQVAMFNRKLSKIILIGH